MSDYKSDVASWINENKDVKFFLLVQGFDFHCPFNPPAPYNKLYADSNYENENLNLDYCYTTVDKDPILNKDEIPSYKVRTIFTVPRAEQQTMDYGDLEFELSFQDAEYLKDLYDGEIR